MWADKVNRECCSPYYGVLVKTEKVEQRNAFQALLSGLRGFSKELEKTPGPTFVADAQLSSVDLSILPWAYRYYVFEHYRGTDFVVPREDPSLAAYTEWFDHVMTLPQVCPPMRHTVAASRTASWTNCRVIQVSRTLPDKARYLEHIAKYASSSARSKVANAVRRGVAAHEIDDELDESHPLPAPNGGGKET